ncbi:MAG: TFIIB-type zinc ribbon-containing protein [Candidatus Bathyarchaeota archaeon]|nr:TFIIB-type zinc ribbon-containing protein [Candidatus Termitimicrobium sp.]
MCETKPCPECNTTNHLHDQTTGETVCRNCGLVIQQTIAFTPPADRIPKHPPSNPIIFTSIAVGTEIDSYQYLERTIAKETKWIVQTLTLPNNTTQMALNYVLKLRRSMRRQNPKKIRLTATQLTALSIWDALKQQNHPLSYDEYTQQITPLIGNVNLMKIQNRANRFIKTQNRIPDTTLITAHINKTINLLVNKHIINNAYANVLNKYAIQMIHKNQGIVACCRPKIVAAAAILAADKLIANRLHLQKFANLTKNGTGKLSALTTTLKRTAPPLPKECAALKLGQYLDKELDSFEP